MQGPKAPQPNFQLGYPYPGGNVPALCSSPYGGFPIQYRVARTAVSPNGGDKGSSGFPAGACSARGSAPLQRGVPSGERGHASRPAQGGSAPVRRVSSLDPRRSPASPSSPLTTQVASVEKSTSRKKAQVIEVEVEVVSGPPTSTKAANEGKAAGQKDYRGYPYCVPKEEADTSKDAISAEASPVSSKKFNLQVPNLATLGSPMPNLLVPLSSSQLDQGSPLGAFSSEPLKWRQPREGTYKVIFLDIDGVLHPASRSGGGPASKSEANYFSAVPMETLAEIVKQTQANIVLSSAWRLMDDKVKLVNSTLAKYGIPNCIGRTPESAGTGGGNGTRIDQIWQWLKEKRDKVEGYVVLDDQDFSTEVIGSSLVPSRIADNAILIDSIINLTTAHVAQAVAKLKQKPTLPEA